MKSFKKIYLVFLAIFLINNFTQIKTYPHLALKNLFNVLKIDDIGFGHVLLHSKWIENMYQYGPGKPPSKESKWEPVFQDDSVAYLVRKLWFRFSEEHSLEPTQAAVQSFLTPEIFGKLMNEIYLAKRDYGELIKAWSNLYIEDIRKNQKKLAELERTGGYKVLIKKMKVLTRELKGITGQYGNAVQNYKRHQDSLDEEEQEDEPNDKTFKKIRKKLAKTKKSMKSLEEQEISKKQSLLEVANKLKLIKGLQYKLRRIGRDLGVGKVDSKSPEVIKAVKNKIQEMLEWIKEAVNFSATGNVYMPRTVMGILWAFFFHKIDKLRSQDEKIKAVNDCIAQIDEKFRNDVKLEGTYASQEFDAFEERLKELDAKKQIVEIFTLRQAQDDRGYDLALHLLISKIAGAFPPAISQGNFGYEYEEGKFSHPRPNCYETAMHDLFSILWYNPKTKKYDDTLFAENIQNGPGFQRFREALKNLALADKNKIRAEEYTDKNRTSLLKLKKILSKGGEDLSRVDVAVPLINRSFMKQEFMNIVSGRPDIIYNWKVDNKKIFELFPSVKNFINLCNYFYGTQAKTVEALGGEDKGISTKNRTIQFEKGDGEDVPNKIKIAVHDKENKVNFNMVVDIMDGHVSLSVPARDQAGLGIVKEGVATDLLEKLLGEKKEVFRQVPAVATAQFIPSLDEGAGRQDDREEREKEGIEDNWHRYVTVFTLLTSPKLLGEEEKKWNLPILNLIYYSLIMKDNCVKMEIIADVVERHPEDYNYFKAMIHNLADKLPINDDFFRGELRRIIEAAKIRDDFFEKLLGDPGQVLFDLVFLEGLKGIEDATERMKNIKNINDSQVIVSAVWFDNKELVKLIMQRDEFELIKNPELLGGVILEKAIQYRFFDIANFIAKNLKNEDEFFVHIVSILELVLEKMYDGDDNFDSYRNIFLAIVNNEKFDAGLNRMGAILFSALELKASGIAEKIMSHTSFKDWGMAMKRAWGEKRSDIAKQVIDHENFDAGGEELQKLLLLILEEFAEGWDDVVLKVIEHPKFDANGQLVGNILSSAESLAKEKPERAKKLREIIDDIKQKQK